MKKLLLVPLIFLLVGIFAITGLAKVELTMWSGPYYIVETKESGWYINRVIGEFEELYPEVNIELEILPWGRVGTDKLAIGIATKTTSDIRLGGASGITSHALQGVISDFSDIVTAEEQADYLPGYVETFAVDGQMPMYMVMGNYGSGGMGINKVLVEKAGAMDLLPLDKPYRNWTVEEYKVFLQKMTEYIKEAGLTDTFTTVFNFGDGSCNAVIIMWVFQCWGVDPFEVVDGKYKVVLNSPEAVEALQWYLDLYNDPTYGVMPGAENTFIDWWENHWLTGNLVTVYGEGAGTIKWYSMPGQEEISEVLECLIVPYPTGPNGSHIKTIDGVGITAFKTGDLEKERYSKLFCQFFATRPYMAEVTGLHSPPTYSSYDPDSPLYQKPLYAGLLEAELDFKRNMEDTSIRIVDFGQKCPVYKQYVDTFAQTMQGVFTGELTAEEGLNIFVDKVNVLLDEFYKENPVG